MLFRLSRIIFSSADAISPVTFAARSLPGGKFLTENASSLYVNIVKSLLLLHNSYLWSYHFHLPGLPK